MSRGRILEFVFLFFPFLLLFVAPCSANNLNHPVIIEVQIAGENIDNDFIKIYNPSDNNLDISGYKLRKRASTGNESSIQVFSEGNDIPAMGYFIWANFRNNYANLIGADASSSATLAKNNSIAFLDANGSVIDALSWGESQSPFAEGSSFQENPIKNQKLERKKINENYQDTDNNNQDFYLNPPNIPTDSPVIEKLLPFYPTGVIINEILPSPAGPDETDEWIEIFNKNNFETDLSLWQITDTSGKTVVYTFPKGTKIPPQNFLVLYRPKTKISLNNNGDGLIFLQPDGKTIDSVVFEKAPVGQSYNRIGDKWFWSKNLTPGTQNIVPTPDPEIENNKSSGEDVKSGKKMAAVGEIFKNLKFFPLLIAIVIAIFAGIIILTIKKLVKK